MSFHIHRVVRERVGLVRECRQRVTWYKAPSSLFCRLVDWLLLYFLTPCEYTFESFILYLLSCPLERVGLVRECRQRVTWYKAPSSLLCRLVGWLLLYFLTPCEYTFVLTMDYNTRGREFKSWHDCYVYLSILLVDYLFPVLGVLRKFLN